MNTWMIVINSMEYHFLKNLLLYGHLNMEGTTKASYVHEIFVEILK